MDIINIALKEYATHEIPGAVNNPRIMQYAKDIGQNWVKNDETPWCAIFLNWCLLQAGYKQTGMSTVDSFINYGNPTARPELGDIVIFRFAENGNEMNHVAIFIRIVDNLVYILGGNQADMVNIIAVPVGWVSRYRKVSGIYLPDDPHNKYRTDTGALNPNYNPNA